METAHVAFVAACTPDGAVTWRTELSIEMKHFVSFCHAAQKVSPLIDIRPIFNPLHFVYVGRSAHIKVPKVNMIDMGLD